MKSRFNVLLATIIGVSAFLACQNEELSNNSLNEEVSTVQNETRPQMAPWEIVMDWRFSRGTCATGPGVCFMDGDGDIVTFYSIAEPGGSGESGELQHEFDKLLRGNNDMDSGVIAFRNEEKGLRLVFSRSLEEESFVVSENYHLNEKLASKLGLRKGVIPAGVYKVDRSRFKNGEVLINF